MSSQSIVLTGGGGKTILTDFEEDGSDARIKKGKDKEREAPGGEECLVRGVVSKTVFIFARLRSDIGGAWDLAAAGTAGFPRSQAVWDDQSVQRYHHTGRWIVALYNSM
jgi:hypothetical protein